MMVALVNTFIGLTPLGSYFTFTLAAIVIALFIFINKVIFQVMRQPDLFAGIEPPLQSNNLQAEQPKKYAASTLTEEMRAKYLKLLLELMEKEKPYLDPDITIEGLAAALSLPAKTLSQVINESLNQSFFDFINSYRIADARKLLSNKEDKKITVLEVMYKVGFNSKSSFNTAFKKMTNMTPTDFKKAQWE
jgi:AraC-like DNA-binding protein